MHHLDPSTTVLTAALALLTALALSSETPFLGGGGRAAGAASVAPAVLSSRAPAWVAMNAVAVSTLPTSTDAPLR